MAIEVKRSKDKVTGLAYQVYPKLGGPGVQGLYVDTTAIYLVFASNLDIHYRL